MDRFKLTKQDRINQYKIIMYNVKGDLEYYIRPDTVRRLDAMGFFDRCAVDRIHPVLLYLAERLQRDWERTPCRFPKRTLLGVVLIFPVLAVSNHISGEAQQMKRLCKDCLHCKSKQTGVVTFRYWCEITKVGVRPWMEKPHPKCPLKSGRAGRFES